MMESSVHSSLHQNSPPNNFEKFDMKMYYPHPYEPDFWHVKKKQILMILKKQWMILNGNALFNI